MLEQIKAKAIELTPTAKAYAPKVVLFAPVVLLPLFVGLVASVPAKPTPGASVTVALPPAQPYVAAGNTPVVASQQVVQTETKIVYVPVPAQNGQAATVKAVEVQAPVTTPAAPAAQPATTAPTQNNPGSSPLLDQVFTQPAPPPKPAPRTVSVTPVQYIAGSKLQPGYPDDLRAAGVEGTVSVRVTVGPDGRPRSIRPTGKTDSRLSSYVQNYGMKNWRFKPATVDGMPGTGNIDISLTFKLTQE